MSLFFLLCAVVTYGEIINTWIGNTLQSDALPVSPAAADVVTAEVKGRFLRLLFAMKGNKRRFKSLLSDFSKVCCGAMAPDVFLSYELA